MHNSKFILYKNMHAHVMGIMLEYGSYQRPRDEENVQYCNKGEHVPASKV